VHTVLHSKCTTPNDNTELPIKFLKVPTSLSECRNEVRRKKNSEAGFYPAGILATTSISALHMRNKMEVCINLWTKWKEH